MAVIILAGKAGCGKAETLQIVCEQIQNIYNCEIHHACQSADQAATSTILKTLHKTIEVLGANMPSAAALKTLLEPGRPSDIVIAALDQEVSSAVAVPIDQNLKIIQKDVQDKPHKQLLANIKDCEKILELLESYL